MPSTMAKPTRQVLFLLMRTVSEHLAQWTRLDPALMEFIMRLPHISTGGTKKAAKMLAKEGTSSLNQCQLVLSNALGYKDFFDLELNAPPTSSHSALTEPEKIGAEIKMSASISGQLSLSPVTVHHILANTVFHYGKSPDFKRSLNIVARVFEETVLPPQGRRKAGQIGKLKSPGRNGEHVILRSFGSPTQVITQKSANASVADFEYIAPQTQLPLFIPMRLYVPYGEWTEQDGARVLFSRDYFPMWRLRDGCVPERLAPWERIEYTKQSWILDEGEMPWHNMAGFDTCIRILEKEGIRSFPRLLDALPLIINDSDIKGFSDAAEALKVIARN